MAGTAQLHGGKVGGGKSRTSPPPGALVGAAALIGFTLLAVFIGRGEGVGFTSPSAGKPVESLAFRAEDQVDGSIAIRDVSDGHLVTMIKPQQDGFIRGTLRGLARSRTVAGIGQEPPFYVNRFENGRFTVTDPETQREIVLEAFGQTNVAAFARLLPSEQKSGETRTH